MERDRAELEAEREGEVQDEFADFTAAMLKDKLKVHVKKKVQTEGART